MSKSIRSTILLKNGSVVRIECAPDFEANPAWVTVDRGNGITQLFPLQAIESIEIVEQKAQSA